MKLRTKRSIAIGPIIQPNKRSLSICHMSILPNDLNLFFKVFLASPGAAKCVGFTAHVAIIDSKRVVPKQSTSSS